MGPDGGSGLLQGLRRQRHGHQPGLVRQRLRQPLRRRCAVPVDDGDLQAPDAVRHLRLAGRGLQLQQRPHRDRPGGPLHGPADRRRDRPRRGHRRPAARRQLHRHEEPVHAVDGRLHGAHHPCHQVGPGPARGLVHGLRQRGRELHQPARARQHDPGDEQLDVCAGARQRRPHLRRQPGRQGVLLVRQAVPRRPRLRTRPGVDDRQGAGHLHQALPRGHRAGEQPRRRRRDQLQLGRLLGQQPGLHVAPDRGEGSPGGQAVPHRGVGERQRGGVHPGRPDDLHLAVAALPGRDADLARPGRRLGRQRTHVVRGRDGHQGLPAHRADVPDRLRGGPRHHAAAVAGAGVRVVVRRAGRA